MTLALESLSSAEPFSIVQDLTLIVAREAVVESMAPVTPYAPAKPERRGWKHTLRGEKISFRRKIVFTVKSLEYEVPGKLRKALWKKRRDDQENALHKIIPDALNGRSLPTFWSTLLHAEELQVEYVPAAIVFHALIADSLLQRKRRRIQHAPVHTGNRRLDVQVCR